MHAHYLYNHIYIYIYILQVYRYARLEEKRTFFIFRTHDNYHSLFGLETPAVSSQPLLHQGREAHVLDMLRHYGGVPDSCFAANLGRAPRGRKRRTDMPRGHWVHNLGLW